MEYFPPWVVSFLVVVVCLEGYGHYSDPWGGAERTEDWKQMLVFVLCTLHPILMLSKIRNFIVRQIITEEIARMMEGEGTKAEFSAIPTVEESLSRDMMPPPPSKPVLSIWSVVQRMIKKGRTYYFLTMQALSFMAFSNPLNHFILLLEFFGSPMFKEIRKAFTAFVEVGKSLLFMMTLLLIFAGLNFYIFADSLPYALDATGGESYGTLYQYFYGGFVSGLMGFAWPFIGFRTKSSAPVHFEENWQSQVQQLLECMWIMLYVFVFGGLVGGQIVDAYAQIRDEDSRLKADLAERCMLCSLDRFTVDTHPAGCSFDAHTDWKKGDHSLWNYLFFLHYVTVYKDPNEYTGIESHVVKVLNSVDKAAKKGFLPLKDCAAFHQKTGEQDTTETLERVLAAMERTEQKVERLADAVGAMHQQVNTASQPSSRAPSRQASSMNLAGQVRSRPASPAPGSMRPISPDDQ